MAFHSSVFCAKMSSVRSRRDCDGRLAITLGLEESKNCSGDRSGIERKGERMLAVLLAWRKDRSGGGIERVESWSLSLPYVSDGMTTSISLCAE